jgi:hypothetical protein
MTIYHPQENSVTFYQDSQFGADFSGQKIDYDLNFSFEG